MNKLMKPKEEPAAKEVVKELFRSEEMSQQARVALLVVSALNFSVEVEEVVEGEKTIEEANHFQVEVTDVDGRYSWNDSMLYKLAGELNVPQEYVELYREMLPRRFGIPKDDLHQSYLDMLRNPSHPGSKSFCSVYTVSKLVIYLIANGCYNARGRTYIQNLCVSMNISEDDYISMERNISFGLSHIQASLTKLQKEEKADKKGHDYKRYAKIGAVSVGAGAILAVTGGLAAPAVAAALLMLGTSTAVAAAAMTSATVMSGLFGGAGMGLAGYKMVKRTRGISEFVFESEENFGSDALKNEKNDQDLDSQQHGAQKVKKWSLPTDKKNEGTSENSDKNSCRVNRLSVMICVSGWMIDKEDYKKSFGIVPHDMDDEERIKRFYQIHCPQKVSNARDDVRAWKSSGSTAGAKFHGEQEKSTLASFGQSVTANLSNIGSSAENDMDEFYDNLTQIYGSDPRLVESLMPAPIYQKYVQNSEDVNDEYVKHIIESITIAFENKKREDDVNIAKLKERESEQPLVKLRTRTPSASPSKSAQKANSSDRSGEEQATYDSESEQEDVSLKDIKLEEKESKKDNSCDEDNPELQKLGEEISNSDKTAEDDTQARLESEFWHWNQTKLSGAYELNLLRWETDMQLELGKSLQQLLKSISENVATKVLQTTVLAALMSAVFVPYSLLRLMDKIDNIWDIGTERADEAGKMMAHVLLKRPQGSRSVSLVGHSMGSRLIFSCLQELYRCKQVYLDARVEAFRSLAQEDYGKQEGEIHVSKKKEKSSFTSSMMSGVKSMWKSGDNPPENSDDKEKSQDFSSTADLSNEPFPLDVVDRQLVNTPADVEDFSVYDFKHADNLVQDVVLLGTPASPNRKAWKKARAAVTGRFINGYSENDFILALIYRYNKLAIKVAGLREIHVAGVENINFSETVKKHTDYCLNMKEILEQIDLHGAPNPDNMFMD